MIFILPIISFLSVNVTITNLTPLVPLSFSRRGGNREKRGDAPLKPT